jgi:hypothetical protein
MVETGEKVVLTTQVVLEDDATKACDSTLLPSRFDATESQSTSRDSQLGLALASGSVSPCA